MHISRNFGLKSKSEPKFEPSSRSGNQKWRLLDGNPCSIKSQFWSKIGILVKNRDFGQKSWFWSKIVILDKNRDFGQKSGFWSKIVILVKNRDFRHKSRFSANIDIFVKNWDFRQTIFLLEILNSKSRNCWQIEYDENGKISNRPRSDKIFSKNAFRMCRWNDDIVGIISPTYVVGIFVGCHGTVYILCYIRRMYSNVYILFGNQNPPWIPCGKILTVAFKIK